MTSEVSERARALVTERLDDAVRLGASLGHLIADPEAFVAALQSGFAGLADAEYRSEQARVAPGGGQVFGVRVPLQRAVERGLRPALRESPPAYLISLAARLIRAEEREIRLLSLALLRHSLREDPERSWQLMRRLGRGATDWISVDTLAEVVGLGILMEPYRWAELEQLVYSPSRWERRLVGSSLAELPFAVETADRTRLAGTPGLTLIESLLGDSEPDVQKALSWALRSWVQVDPVGVEALVRREAAVAAVQNDGHRAWVLRDAAAALPAPVQAEIRELLRGIRRRGDAQPTSRAAEAARLLHGLPAARPGPEAPLSV
ncbi:MAG: DNA alkylation repair protein [Candidatus Limnocylindrales bacterium]